MLFKSMPGGDEGVWWHHPVRWGSRTLMRGEAGGHTPPRSPPLPPLCPCPLTAAMRQPQIWSVSSPLVPRSPQSKLKQHAIGKKMHFLRMNLSYMYFPNAEKEAENQIYKVPYRSYQKMLIVTLHTVIFPLGTAAADDYGPISNWHKQCCGSWSEPDPEDPYVSGPPDPVPLVRGTVWIRLRILLSSSKNSNKNLDSYCFVTFTTFYLWKMMQLYLHKVISK